MTQFKAKHSLFKQAKTKQYMSSFKSVIKGILLVISGIAIIVVGGFMIGAVARLWLPKDKKKQKDSGDLDDIKKAG